MASTRISSTFNSALMSSRWLQSVYPIGLCRRASTSAGKRENNECFALVLLTLDIQPTVACGVLNRDNGRVPMSGAVQHADSRQRDNPAKTKTKTDPPQDPTVAPVLVPLPPIAAVRLSICIVFTSHGTASCLFQIHLGGAAR